jgi:hypothetical protein
MPFMVSNPHWLRLRCSEGSWSFCVEMRLWKILIQL